MGNARRGLVMAIRAVRLLVALAVGSLPFAATAQSCAPASAIQRVAFAGADTTLALPSAYFASTLAVTAGDRALQFEADTDTLSGFLLDVPAAAVALTGRAQADAVIARFTSQAGLLGATTVIPADLGRVIVTHDRFNAVADIRIDLVLAPSAGRRDLRNRATAVAGNHALVDFTGFSTGGPFATGYSVLLSVVVRPGATNRVRVLGVVGTTTAIDNDALGVGAAADDLVDGVALARGNVVDVPVCDQETAGNTGARNVDLIVATYTGGTLDTLRATAAATIGTIFDALVAAGADVRVGVVPHTSNSRDLGSGNGGVLRSAFQRDRATMIAEITNTSGTNGCNWAITAGDDALVRALPRTSGAENALKLRGSATAFMLYMDGEHAQEVESNVCGQGALGTGQVDTTRTTPNAAQQAAIDNIVAPYIARLQANSVVAFGLLQSLATPFCSGLTEDGRGYVELVTATGGARTRVCDAGSAAIAAAMIAALPQGASFALPEPPIAPSLRVRVVPGGTGTPIEVPRSRVDGYDLDRDANAVVIVGDTYRPVAGDRVDVSFELWPSPLFANGFE